jgi:hypothetical protein
MPGTGCNAARYGPRWDRRLQVSHSINLKPRPQRGFLCMVDTPSRLRTGTPPNFSCHNALHSLHRHFSPTFTRSGNGYRLLQQLSKRLGMLRGR